MMEVYNKLIGLDDDELDSFVSERIEELEDESYKNNNGNTVIGYDLDINPRPKEVLCSDDDRQKLIKVNSMYCGYVKRNTKMVYGRALNRENGLQFNNGFYYYVDTDDYLYEFCRYIRDIELDSEFDLFLCIQIFVKKYFYALEENDRDTMFTLLARDDDYLFPPIKEHKFSSFKKRGSAVCTEIALVAQNIMSFFGIDSYLIIGDMIENNGPDECHAYNIVSYTNSYTGKKEDHIIDFASYVLVYDIGFKPIGSAPYVAPIEKFDAGFLNSFINDELYITDSLFMYMEMKNTFCKLGLLNRKRDYFVGKDFIVKKYIK